MPERTVTVDFTNTPKPAPVATARTWSPQQDAVFSWFAAGRGNLVVRARAGTGKTTTIVEGVSRAPERQILLAAFNKAIATELQARVGGKVECKTLHSLGLKFIRRNWKDVKIDDDVRGITLARQAAPDAPEHVLRLIRDLHTKAREIAPFARCGADVEIVAARFNLLPDDDGAWDARKVCEAAHRAMVAATAQSAHVDFADMIFLPLVKGWVRPWYDMVVVDEAQDMTVPQLLIATGACRKTGRICVVGDDRQAIYGFRGADSDSLDRLKDELRAVELGLTTTYRCGSLIVEAARDLVPDYTAAPGAAKGEIVRRGVEDALDEMRAGDFVISRTNAPLIKLCMTLLKRGTRAQIRGRDVGRGVLALVRKLRVSSVAEVSAKLTAYVDREVAKAQKLGDKARDARVEFVNDQAELLNALCEGASDVSELERRVHQLFSDDDKAPAVMLSTVHRVKGLETERTFLLEGTFRQGAGEESNLRYVAISRAKTRLCWVTT